MRIKLLFLLVGCFLWSSMIFAQDSASATIQFDRTEIKLGEQITATLTLSHPVTDYYEFALLKDTLIKAIEIVDLGKIDTTYAGTNLSTKVLTRKMILTSFDTGYHVIPPIVFPGENDSLKTEAALIKLMDVEVDMPEATEEGEPPLEIKDIKNIKEKGFSIWEWIKVNKLWIILAIVLMAGIWAYFKYLHPKLKNKGVTNIIQKKIIPPFEIAIEKLKKLENQKLWQNGEVKNYHIQLSEIVRAYIEDQMAVPALESTTIEITKALKDEGISNEIILELKNTLELSDLVKFAKHFPIGSENEESMKMAHQFIEITKPKTVVSDTNTEEVSHV